MIRIGVIDVDLFFNLTRSIYKFHFSNFQPYTAECPKDMPEDIYEATSLLARILENLYIRLGSDDHPTVF